MNYFVVLVAPYDDQSIIPDVWHVAISPDEETRHMTIEAFQADYENALTAVREDNPEEWNITEVLTKLKVRWAIEVEANPISLTY